MVMPAVAVVIAPVPAAVLGGGLRDHGLGPAVKGQAVTAAHENRLDAFALVGEETGGEADKEAGIAVIQLDGVGIELLFGCAGVLQSLAQHIFGVLNPLPCKVHDPAICV